MGSTKTAKSAQPVPLGPDSLTWKYFGDLRTGMLGVWIGSLQNMYPQLGAGVEDHSILLREPLQRVARSVYPIMGVVYDGERARQTGEQIKGFHTSIKGVDAAGRRYHALDPETFYWAHATFFMLILKVAEYFCGGLTEAEKRQLFEEHVQWYRMYGMSMRPVPQTWEDFRVYWNRMCREELENTWAAREVLNLKSMPKPLDGQWIPDWLWSAYLRVMEPFAVWVTVGLYDEPVRELMGYRWSARDAWLHRRFGQGVNLAFKLLPRRRRMHPRARAGWDRAEGRIPADAPLVHTPARNLPPITERDKGIHYLGAAGSPR